MSLYGTGGYAQIKIDVGVQNPVSGFQSTGNKSIYGPNLPSDLPTEYNILAGDGAAQFQQSIAPTTTVWVNVSGIWKEGAMWIKIGGAWKSAIPSVKVSGVWE